MKFSIFGTQVKEALASQTIQSIIDRYIISSHPPFPHHFHMVVSASSQSRTSTIRTLIVSSLLLIISSHVDPTHGLTGFVFILVLLYFLYNHGLREKWSGSDEVSAYSVFNTGHRELAGTFSAKKFDDQLRHRATDDERSDDAISTFNGVATSTICTTTAKHGKNNDDARQRRAQAAETRMKK